jgi:hypothetical protein
MKLKIIYDFFRLWIKWGDRKEAWEDAKFINDKGIQKELKEMSAMGAGCISGGLVKNTKQKLIRRNTLKDQNMKSRQQLCEEIAKENKLRKVIITLTEQVLLKRKQKKVSDEQKLREIVQKMVLKEAKTQPAPHFSTGINFLRNLLRKIIPVIEVDFKQLTTSKFQRDSFRAHIVNATKTSMERERNTMAAGSPDELEQETPSDMENLNEIEVSVDEKDEQIDNLGNESGELDNPEQDKFISIDDDEEEEKKKKEEELRSKEITPEEFKIPDQDETGRNLAFETYQKIEKEITKTFF